jgi:hypothetical protein
LFGGGGGLVSGTGGCWEMLAWEGG